MAFKLIFVAGVLSLGFFIGGKLDQIKAGGSYEQQLEQCGVKIPLTEKKLFTSPCTVRTQNYGWPFVVRKEHEIVESSRTVKFFNRGTITENQNRLRNNKGASLNAVFVLILVATPVGLLWPRTRPPLI